MVILKRTILRNFIETNVTLESSEPWEMSQCNSLLVSNNWVLLPFLVFSFLISTWLYWKMFLSAFLVKGIEKHSYWYIHSLILGNFIVNARLPNVLAIYFKNVRFLSEGKFSGKCFSGKCKQVSIPGHCSRFLLLLQIIFFLVSPKCFNFSFQRKHATWKC